MKNSAEMASQLTEALRPGHGLLDALSNLVIFLEKCRGEGPPAFFKAILTALFYSTSGDLPPGPNPFSIHPDGYLPIQ